MCHPFICGFLVHLSGSSTSLYRLHAWAQLLRCISHHCCSEKIFLPSTPTYKLR